MTYGAELRAERKDRPSSVIAFDPDRYARFGRAALQHIAIAHEVRGDKIIILPDPDGPSSARSELSATSSDTSSSAAKVPKCLVTLRM
jgi:hypothetical protein